MSYTSLNYKEVKCRKPHKCSYCGIQISVNEKAINYSGIYDKEFQHGYICKHCDELIPKLHNEDIIDMYDFDLDNLSDAAEEYYCGMCVNACQTYRMTDEEYEQWEKSSIHGDNERCKLGAYLKHCRCEFYEEYKEESGEEI